MPEESAVQSFPLRRRLRAASWNVASRGLAKLPRSWATRILAGPAAIARHTGPGRIAANNLELALGGTHDAGERARILHGVFRHAAEIAATSAWLAHAQPARRAAWLRDSVRVHPSLEHLQNAYDQGQGVIVATAHLGQWDLLAASLAQRGFVGSVVGNHRKRDPSGEWWVAMRRHYGVETWPQDVDPKQLLRELRSGRLLGLLCDLEVRRLEGEFVPLFGIDALTMGAPAALARASRAPIVPVRCVRLAPEDRHYTLLADEPLRFDLAAAPKEERTRILRALNATFEGWIRAHPEQWAWYQPRWRTRPGEREHVPIAERQRRARAGGETS